MNLFRWSIVAVAVVVASWDVGCFAVGPLEADDDLFSEVSAIFADHCVGCHNDADQEGGFSLETADSFYDSGLVEPGSSSGELLSTLRGSDGEPPSMPKEAPPLSADQVATIGRWIASGGDWPEGFRVEQGVADFDWWSFKRVVRPALPKDVVGSPKSAVAEESRKGKALTGNAFKKPEDRWIRTPIDAFVLARLKQKGLTHSPEADRRTLIRRLTYDLIGLPPTPAEVQSFVADADPNAYEALVDRLLESKHYGERWARHWLDVVKYADTCGYDKDKLRPSAWPYRDYVIRSFNDDKPYARFVREQIAGDVLYPGEPDGILGLGFIAAGPWDFIGHVEVSESKIDGKVARSLDRDEMVSNTMNTFCSVTIQCARCHNHKFDPFTQEHYYGLQAIFAAVDRAERRYDLDPSVEKRRRDLEDRLRGSEERIAGIEKEMADAGGPRLVELDEMIEQLQAKITTNKQPEFGYHSGVAKSRDTEKWVEVDLGREVELSKVILRPCHDDYAGIGAGFGFPVRFRVEVSTSPLTDSLADRRGSAGERASVDGAQDDDGSLVRVHRLGDFDATDFPNPGLVPVEVAGSGVMGRYVRVTATKLALRSNDYMFALAELQIVDAGGNDVVENASVTGLDSIEAPVRWSTKNLNDGLWARSGDPELSGRLAVAKKERSRIVAKIESEDRRSRLKVHRDEVAKSRKQLDSLPEGKMVYAAATHFEPQNNFKPTGGTPRPIHLLHRGNVGQAGKRVGPGLLPLGGDVDWRLDAEAGESQRRADLARWLTDDRHPLVWRSIVNRVWQYHFGAGLVDTPNDFGRMGAEPTHPDLLDWLAAEFRDGGQSFKRLHRLIVTSSVYRQSSDRIGASAAIDSSNQYLWRMSRRRLEAEEIRDSILSVSGRLDKTMGGPGFYLFALEKPEHSPHYEYHKFDPSDPKSHRRSVYRFVVRSQPDPFMTTLDCADSSQSTPKRLETLTALQALSLMNNRFNLEMAQRFADRLRRESAELPGQVDRAMMLIAGRLPDDDERAEMVHYAEANSLANLCRMMFNLSEFVFLD